MPQVIRSERCPICALSNRDTHGDNLKTFSNGSQFCFRCKRDPIGKKRGAITEDLIVTEAYLPDRPSATTKRGIGANTFKIYGVTTGSSYFSGVGEVSCDFYPLYKSGVITNHKCRAIQSKSFRFDKPGETLALFGWHIFDRTKPTIITEGELDALSAYQLLDGKFNCLSVVHGAAGALRDITPYKKLLLESPAIYIAFDADDPGRDAATEVLDFLKSPRVFRVSFQNGYKDCNEILTESELPVSDLRFALETAERYQNKLIATEDTVLQRILSRYESPEGRFIPTGFPTLDKATYGFETGRLVTIAAGTGVGKSTFLTQLLVNIAREDRKAVLFSLEMDTDEVTAWLTEMYTGLDQRSPLASKEVHIHTYNTILKNRFFFNEDFNEIDTDELIATIEEYHICHGAKVFAIDHKDLAIGEDQYGGKTKRLFERLKAVANKYKLLILVTSQLKKSSEDGNDCNVNLERLFGSSGAKNASDYVIGLSKATRFSDVTKASLLKNRGQGKVCEFEYYRDTDYRLKETNVNSSEHLRKEDTSSERPLPDSVRTDQAEVSEELHPRLLTSDQNGTEDLYRGKGVSIPDGRQSQDESGQSSESWDRHPLSVTESRPAAIENNDNSGLVQQEPLSMGGRDSNPRIMGERVIAVDLETKGLFTNGKAPEVLCYSWADSDKADSGTDLELLRKEIETSSLVVFHNASFDKAILETLGFSIPKYIDTQLLVYALDQTLPTSLEESCKRHNKRFKKLDKPWKGKYPTEVTDELLEYAKRDAEATLELYTQLSSYPGLVDFVNSIDIPHQDILMEMTRYGIKTNADKIHTIQTSLNKRIEEIISEILTIRPTKFYETKTLKTLKAVGGWEYWGEGEEGIIHKREIPINLNSEKHIAQLLGEKLTKKTPSGQFATDMATLSEVPDPIAALIIEYAGLNKILTSFINPFTTFNDEQSRIHTQFNQATTVTGRLSSSEPNLQNIPARSEIGKEIRTLFLPSEGCILLDGDLSNIEGRIFAHLLEQYGGDKRLADVFRSNGDFHATNAALFGITRDQAKTLLYLKIYGGGAGKLAQSLGLTYLQAKAILERLDHEMPAMKQVQETIAAIYKQKGKLNSLVSKRRIKLRDDRDYALFNYLIQGTAADILKILINKTAPLVRAVGGKHLLTIHDELLIEAPIEIADELAKTLTAEWNDNSFLSVPVVTEFKTGMTWGDAK